SADGQHHPLAKKAGGSVPVIDADAVVTGVGAKDELLAGGEAECGGGVDVAALFSHRGDLLKELKDRVSGAAVVGVDGQVVFQLRDHIHKTAVRGKPEKAGSRFQLAADHVGQPDMAGFFVEA